jgi:hypothetical protein
MDRRKETTHNNLGGKEMKIYSCIPNGDYNNEDTSISNAFGRADFELNSGQDWILLSKKELTDEQYSRLLEDLKEVGE